MSCKLFVSLAFAVCTFAVTDMVHAKAFQDIPGFGRNLIIRNLPPIPELQSNLYEVYMEPFLYVSSIIILFIFKNNYFITSVPTDPVHHL